MGKGNLELTFIRWASALVDPQHSLYALYTSVRSLPTKTHLLEGKSYFDIMSLFMILTFLSFLVVSRAEDAVPTITLGGYGPLGWDYIGPYYIPLDGVTPMYLSGDAGMLSPSRGPSSITQTS